MSVRRLRYGMIGGGVDAFIGGVHRAALRLDGETDLVAGAFSSTVERSKESGRMLGVDPARTYGSWTDMLAAESARPEADRLDFVVIVTPNDLHFDVACGFTDAGFHVVTDKPMVRSLTEADELVRRVEAAGTVFGVTYNYSGYPMVQAAADHVRSGGIGTIRRVEVMYHQSWLATKIEADGQKQASWRTDPARAGVAGALGDIGSHAEHLARVVSGLSFESVAAEVRTLVEGRAVDDDVTVMIRCAPDASGNRASGLLVCSQVCCGEANNLTLRVWGTRGAISWRQESPNDLQVADASGRWSTRRRGDADLGTTHDAFSRLPGGHPEGFHEAFANVYRGILQSIRGDVSGHRFPTVHDGRAGLAFVDAAIASGHENGVWRELS